MPSSILAQPNAPAATSVGKSGRGSAGVYELQLRRKLLQQQLGVVEDECKRVGKVVAKKHLAKLCRQENAGGRGHAHAGAAAAARGSCERGGEADTAGNHGGGQRHVVAANNSDGLPSIGVAGAGGGGAGGQADTSLRGIRRTKKKLARERIAAAQQQRPPHLLAAEPFKKGGCIDHTKKKRILQDKQREIERDAAAERNARPARRSVSVRDEVAAAPSIFPDRYLRGEVPCSKHCSVGKCVRASVEIELCPSWRQTPHSTRDRSTVYIVPPSACKTDVSRKGYISQLSCLYEYACKT